MTKLQKIIYNTKNILINKYFFLAIFHINIKTPINLVSIHKYKYKIKIIYILFKYLYSNIYSIKFFNIRGWEFKYK